MKLWDFSLYVVIKTSSISSTSAVDPSVSPKAHRYAHGKSGIDIFILTAFELNASCRTHSLTSTKTVQW